VEILRQPQYQPLPMEKQVTILFAGARGFLDKYPVDVLAKYETGVYGFIEERFPKVFQQLKEKKAIDSELETLMSDALKAYDEEFKDTIK
jgi:F-type H+/Na+-transporting ATPase subunit alpha